MRQRWCVRRERASPPPGPAAFRRASGEPAVTPPDRCLPLLQVREFELNRALLVQQLASKRQRGLMAATQGARTTVPSVAGPNMGADLDDSWQED